MSQKQIQGYPFSYPKNSLDKDPEARSFGPTSQGMESLSFAGGFQVHQVLSRPFAHSILSMTQSITGSLSVQMQQLREVKFFVQSHTQREI